MCLDKVTDRELTREQKFGVGYKVFRNDNNKLTSLFMRGVGKNIKQVPINRWIHERAFNPYGTNVKLSYPSGFHIFKNRNDAISYYHLSGPIIIKKIKYRNAHTLGLTSFHRDTVVAKEMLVLDRRYQ